MRNEVIKAKLDNALRILLKNDSDLIKRDVGERIITHKLAEYLQAEFVHFHVDCEYNRNFGDSKRLNLIVEELTKVLRDTYQNRIDRLPPHELLSISTYPDIIVHIRQRNKHNLLIVEVKKDNSEVPLDLDIQKLKSFTEPGGDNPYHYQLGARILIRIGGDERDCPEVIWYTEGEEEI